MRKTQNPILNFRSSAKYRIAKKRDNYDIKIGGRIDSARKLIIETEENNKMYLSTLITETREAIDSCENS